MVQRLSLHLRGVKVPALGTIQDRVFREALTQERMLEAKKAEFNMLILLMSPSFGDDTGRAREWRGTVSKLWRQYVGMMFNTEIPDASDDDKMKLEYYQQVVKGLKPVLAKTDRDTFQVTGLDALRK